VGWLKYLRMLWLRTDSLLELGQSALAIAAAAHATNPSNGTALVDGLVVVGLAEWIDEFVFESKRRVPSREPSYDLLAYCHRDAVLT
jgi:hypothetical protein